MLHQDYFQSISLNTPLNQLQYPQDQLINTINFDDYTLLQFNSKSPTQAHFLYIKDGILIQKSTSTYTNQDITLADYISKYGNPKNSIKEVPDYIHDSFSQTRHIWPQQGLAVISNGADTNAQVFRVFEFQPTSSEEYFDTLGVGIASNSAITLQPTPTNSPDYSSPTNTNLPIIALIIALIAITITYTVIRKKRQN